MLADGVVLYVPDPKTAVATAPGSDVIHNGRYFAINSSGRISV